MQGASFKYLINLNILDFVKLDKYDSKDDYTYVYELCENRYNQHPTLIIVRYIQFLNINIPISICLFKLRFYNNFYVNL